MNSLSHPARQDVLPWSYYRLFFTLFLELDQFVPILTPNLTESRIPSNVPPLTSQEQQSSCFSGSAVLPGCLLANSEWSCGKLSDILSGGSCGRGGICCQMHQEGWTLINSLSCLHSQFGTWLALPPPCALDHLCLFAFRYTSHLLATTWGVSKILFYPNCVSASNYHNLWISTL